MNDFSQMNIEDYLQIGYRRIWWIVIPVIIFAAGGYVVAHFLPKEYVANTLVLVEGQKIPSNYVATTVTTEVARRLQTIQEEVMSRSRLYAIMERFNLFADQLGDVSTDQLISRMRKNIDIQIKNRDAFAIYYQGKDPKLVAQVANALTQQFINANLKIREEQARETANFMGEMLLEQQELLKSRETRLAQFLKAHPGELPEHTSRNIRLIEQLSLQITTRQEDLKRAEETKIMLKNQIATLLALPPAQIKQSSTRDLLLEKLETLEEELSLLKVSHTDLHPKIRAKKHEVENLKVLIYQLPKDINESKEFDASGIENEEEKEAAIGKFQKRLDAITADIEKLHKDQAESQDQLTTREELLKRQEMAWSDFLAKHPDVLPEPMDKNVRIIEQLNIRIMSKQEELDHLIKKKELLGQKITAVKTVNPAQLQRARRSPDPALLQQMEKLEGELTLLRANYTDTHPEVQSKLKEIDGLKVAIKKRTSPNSSKTGGTATIAETIHQTKIKELKQELARAKETIKFLKADQVRFQKKIELYQEKVENAPNLEVQLKQLTRKYDQERKQYEELLAKNLDAELARKLELRQKGEQFIQIDEAVPPSQPFKPDIKKVITLSTMLGVGLGFALAFLREYFDRTFVKAKDLEKSIGIRVLASIPYVPELSTSKNNSIFNIGENPNDKRASRKNLSRRINALDEVLPSSIQEFYRVLKVKIEQRLDKHPKPSVFIVTSTAPQEGKTTTAINLAWIMTKGLNKKAILLECDFYRPKVASYLGIQTKLGLCDYLNGKASLTDVLVGVSPNKFSVIPAGTVLENAEESIESHRMLSLLNTLKEDFDYIVIDTPSVMATIHESNTLTPLVDGILFVVRAGQTPREHITHAITLLDKNKLLGGVLNFGPVAKRASYERYTGYKVPETGKSRDTKRKPNRKDLVISKPPSAIAKRNEKQPVRNVDRKKRRQNPQEELAQTVNSSNKLSDNGKLNRHIKTKDDGAAPEKVSVREKTAMGSTSSVNDVSLKSRIHEYLSGSNGKGLTTNHDGKKVDGKLFDHQLVHSKPIAEKDLPPQEISNESEKKNTAVNNRNSDVKPSNQKAYIRMILDDKKGNPYADKDYVIVIDGKVYNGKTTVDGLVDQEIPADAKKGELTLRPNKKNPSEVLTWPLHIDNNSRRS